MTSPFRKVRAHLWAMVPTVGPDLASGRRRERALNGCAAARKVRPYINCLAIAALLAATAVRSPAQDEAFGSAATQGQAALIGILYDLKQTQQREPTKETERTYRTVITEFLQSNWDEDVLNRYFRVTRPVYTTQILIPTMNADQAPKAFGVSDTVKPRMWVVHYKGQVAPPEDGIYRFSGDADDIIAVRVNGRTVLVAGRQDCLPPNSVWKASEPDIRDRRPGDWISLKSGETVDFDVIIGERPGGQFRALLHIEKQGASSTGRPPIFKLAPSSPRNNEGGPDTSWSVWSAKQ
jgi:hypothetical protein